MMAANWEELEQKYSGQADAVPAANDAWSALEQKYAVPVAAKGSGESGSARSKAPKEATWLERGMALPAAVNRAAYTVLPGLPVDTMANVIDLGKAGIGYATSKIKGLVTGKDEVPPAWTEPMDRRNVVGSSEWFAKNLNKGAETLGVRSPIDNPRPDDPLARVIYSGGLLAGSSINPNPQAKVGPMQQLLNTGTGALSGITSGLVNEINPEWAGVASFAPQVAGATIAGASKLAVRGGETGRRNMEQRIVDLKNGGIEKPSVGLASGNRAVMGLENILAQTPFSSDLFLTRSKENIAGMQAKTNQLRDAISPEFGPVVAGEAIQADLRGPFRDRINATTRALNDRVGQEVGPNFFTLPENSLVTSRAMSTPIPGAPATSGSLINNRIAGIADNLASDVVGTVIPGNPLMNAPDRYQRFDGVISNTPPGIPFNTLKNLRTSIGEEAGSNAIMGTPEQAQFKRLYGAMSEDMRQAVNAADRQNAGVPVGPLQPSQQPGAIALNRANRYYSTAMDRAEELNGIANRNTPEGAYKAVAGSLNSGPTIYERLRGTIDPKTRQKLVATIVDDLGRANPGQQGADGDAWSPRTFLTNFSKLNENGGGKALFTRLPGGKAHADNLLDIAKTAEMLGDASKVWANPSGTAPALTARGTIYALTAGAFFHPLTAAATAGGLAAGNVASRLLLNPMFSNWLAKAPTVSPDKMRTYAQRLVANADLSGDKQLKQDVKTYLRLVEDGSQNVNQ
jgi:hypothetical protein